ncbi:hypothetical protein RchiOBHm_Chr4g0389411 [Rosa chinensis]|uniref:Uncharacterized protein n=1 Tax=Rosa chinensis TaxID=74649 RepID=A0A2P6QPY8_ROSCH|nr:hypothetical protein RchiOBHm_Chr4g0389411 [Rosa chinensis]
MRQVCADLLEEMELVFIVSKDGIDTVRVVCRFKCLSNKLPKGRHLIGDSVVYDVGVWLLGEFQPQLEVTPITKYDSAQLVLSCQIVVNKSYVCDGLKQGNIRVLNIWV